jgi:glycosyltransferase involved in cell wall biosynthesis
MPYILKRHSDMSLVIGGETEPAMQPYRNRLQRQAEELGCAHRIHWVGKLTQAEMAWCFRQCEAFLMTSRVEACPNTVLEAMSQSCLSVSTTSPPMPEMYGDTAFLYRAGNSEELAAQVDAALSMDAADRYIRKSAARRRAAEFSWHRTMEETAQQLLLAAGRTGRLRAAA